LANEWFQSKNRSEPFDVAGPFRGYLDRIVFHQRPFYARLEILGACHDTSGLF